MTSASFYRKVKIFFTFKDLENDPRFVALGWLIILLPIFLFIGIGFVLGWFACKYWGLG